MLTHWEWEAGRKMSYPAINHGLQLRNLRMNKDIINKGNLQYVEIWRPTTFTTSRGDFADNPTYTFGGNLDLKDAIKVTGVQVRIVRSRRGRRTNEGNTPDQIEVASSEWCMFYPKGIIIFRGDKVVDSEAQVFQILSFTSGQSFKWLNEAILREVL